MRNSRDLKMATYSSSMSKTSTVLENHGKIASFFRSYVFFRPSRRKGHQVTRVKEGCIFGCDLSEHLLKTSRDVPLVLKCCAEFIEEYGIVNGIYRLSGVSSNIQRLREYFDHDRQPDLTDEAILQDVHCVSSLLKMYFREVTREFNTC